MSLFSATHIAILGALVISTVALSLAVKREPISARGIRWGLGSLLAVNELAWYGFRLYSEGFRFPEALPLHLCDLTLWLTVFAVFSLNRSAYEVAYYGGLGGSGLAVLTPDLWVQFPSYPAIYFFLSHGFVVVTLITLAWGGILRPRPGSLWRVYALLNLYTLGVAGFNYWFGTNYMYLRTKPASASLLDYFGPWPLYVFVADVFALGVFWLLWLPLQRAKYSWKGSQD